MSNIKPIKTKVLLAAIEQEDKHESGLILTGSSGQAQFAFVIAIGSEVTDVAIGDKVFPTWGATKLVKTDEGERVIIDQKDIVLIVD